MKLEQFLQNIKEEEINLYKDIVDVYHKEDIKRSEYEPKDDSEEDSQKWRSYIKGLYNICDDYDVSEYSRYITDKGYEFYINRLNKDIDAHIDKLKKSITKTVGDSIIIQQLNDKEFKVFGNISNCKITKTTCKITHSKKITKTRLQITDIEQVENKSTIQQEDILQDNEFIKNWKLQELQAFKEQNTKFWDKYNELKKQCNEAKNKEEKDNLLYKLISFKKENSFFYQYGYSKDFESKCIKVINQHFKRLQNKVQDKIGQIQEIYETGNNGYDYYFEGTLGSCNVEVILAGGYNIQRLHTRWIIKNVKLNK